VVERCSPSKGPHEHLRNELIRHLLPLMKGQVTPDLGYEGVEELTKAPRLVDGGGQSRIERTLLHH
jgi:hypothetical protein